MSEAHKFCLLLVSDLLFRYTQHAGLKKLKVLKYRGHGISGALSTRVCKAGFQEETDETIKGKVLRDFGPPFYRNRNRNALWGTYLQYTGTKKSNFITFIIYVLYNNKLFDSAVSM